MKIDFECVDMRLDIPLVPSFDLKVSECDMDDSAPSQLYFAKKYFIKWSCGAAFYANNATFDRALKDAEKRCVQHFFAPVIREIELLRAVAYKHNDSELHQAIDKCIKACSVE